MSRALPHLEGVHDLYECLHMWKQNTHTHVGQWYKKRLDVNISLKVRKDAHIVDLYCFVNTQARLAEGKWCHLTENHCIVPLWLLGNCNWTGIAMQHNSCLHNWTIKILKCHYFGHIHLNKGPNMFSTSWVNGPNMRSSCSGGSWIS